MEGKGKIMVEHPNAVLMRKIDDLLAAGDFPGFLALHTEDAVMHVPGKGPISGDFRGRDGIAGAFQKEMFFLDGAPEFERREVVGTDEHAVEILTQRLRRGGQVYEGRQTVVAHVRDGMLSEVWFQPDDQEAFDAFFE